MLKKKKPNESKKIGRPTDMTPETIEKLENAFSMGCSDLEACLLAGIGKSTLYNYQKVHPEFVERKEVLKETLILKSRTVIANALNLKDKDIAKWYLEKKCKEFSTKADVNIGNLNKTPFEIKVVG